MSKVNISFVVAVYNIEAYIERCIKSIISIKSPLIEIILVNDGSTDGSLEICKKYSDDKRVKIISQENKGLPDARNTGLYSAQGEWICFIDGDDFLDEKFEENIITKLDNSVDIVCFGYSNYFNENNTKAKYDFSGKEFWINNEECEKLRKGLLDNEFLKKQYFYNKNIMYTATWGKIIKKKVIKNNNLNFVSGVSWGEDVIFSYKIFSVTKKVKVIDLVGYHYRIRMDSMTRVYSENILNQYIRFMEEMRKEVLKESSLDFEKMFWTMAAKQYLTIVRRNIFNSSNPNSLNSRKKYFLETKNIELIASAFVKADYSRYGFVIKIGAIICKHNYFYLLNILYKLLDLKDKIKYYIR